MEASTALSTPDAQARSNAKGMTGWMKFIGIMNIIGGCLQALTIFGLVFAWLPIWLGVVLTNAGSRAKEYADKGDTASLEGMTGKLRTYFMLNGIVMIVSLALGIIVGIAWLVLILTGVLSSANWMDYFNKYR